MNEYGKEITRKERERERGGEKALSQHPNNDSCKKKTETLSDVSHAVTNAISTAKNPLGNATIEAFLKVDAAEFAAWNASAKTCNNASILPKPKLSFAFQGSGLLLPFYSGVVQALQDRCA